MRRIFIAQVLRGVGAFALGLAIIVSVLTIVAIAVAALNEEQFGEGYGVGYAVVSGLITVALLLCIARLARLAIRGLVNTDEPE